MFFDLFYLHTA